MKNPDPETGKAENVLAKWVRTGSAISRKPWRKILGLVWWVLLVVVTGIVGYTVWRNRETVLLALQAARYGFFLLTFLCYAAAQGTVGLGWHLVMTHMGGHRSFVTNIKIHIYTLAAKRLPGTLWYIAGRAILYQRLGVPKRVSSLASGVEIVLSIVSGLMVGAPALFMEADLSPGSVAIFIAVELIGLCLLAPPILSRLLKQFGYSVAPGQLSIVRTASWLAAYSVMWIFGGLMTCTVLAALYPLSSDAIPLTISLWSLTGAISFAVFVLPNNFGLTEITLSFMLSHIVPLPIAAVTALLLRVLTTVFDLMCSSLILLERDTAISAQIGKR
jgi:hypothetical protein